MSPKYISLSTVRSKTEKTVLIEIIPTQKYSNPKLQKKISSLH